MRYHQQMEFEAALVRLCGRLLGFMLGVALIITIAMSMSHAAVPGVRNDLCGPGDVETTGSQGTTCTAPEYFPKGQDWSQDSLNKAAPALDGSCPNRYAYRDESGFILFCWGTSK